MYFKLISFLKNALLFANKFAADYINTGSNCRRYFYAALFILALFLHAIVWFLLSVLGCCVIILAGVVLKESWNILNILLALFVLVIGLILLCFAREMKLIMLVFTKAISSTMKNGAPVAHVTVYSRIEEGDDKYILYE